MSKSWHLNFSRGGVGQLSEIINSTVAYDTARFVVAVLFQQRHGQKQQQTYRYGDYFYFRRQIHAMI